MRCGVVRRLIMALSKGSSLHHWNMDYEVAMTKLSGLLVFTAVVLLFCFGHVFANDQDASASVWFKKGYDHAQSHKYEEAIRVLPVSLRDKI